MHALLTHSESLLQGSPSLSLHAPMPLHVCVPLHTGALSELPKGIFVHTPTVAAKLQDLHVPVQTASQQTPSAQKVLLQSFAMAHASPLHFFVQ